MKKIISIISITTLSVFIFSGCFTKNTSNAAADLTFYGLDNSDAFESIINQYRASHPNIRIKYKKFNNAEDYENLLVNEIAEGEGPDIFYVHNTWLPRHLKKTVPLQSESLTAQKFSEVFVNVASDDFIQKDPNDGIKKIYALPLYVDTLGVYYNKQMFEQKVPERGKPASNWDTFKQEADKFRVQGEDGSLKQALIALGRADNIKLSADILYNFFVQAGISFYSDDFKLAQFANDGKEVFEFLMSFSDQKNKNYSWSADIISPMQELGEVEAFLAGKVAAILGYSDLYWRLENDLKNVKTRNSSVISMNDVGVVPVPQIATDAADYKVWTDYYGLAVSRNSKSPKTSWDFVQFAASRESGKSFHAKTHRPAARRDLIEEQKKEPITDVFVSQVGYAASYPVFSDTKFAQILKDAIASASSGQTPREALSRAQERVNELLKAEAPDGIYPKVKVKAK